MKDRTGKTLTVSGIITKSFNRFSTVLLELEVYLLHLAGYIPLHRVRRFFYRLAGVKIGKGSALHMGIIFYNPRNIEIGEDSIIGEGSVLDGREKLSVGNHVDVASEVMIYNCEHNIHDRDFSANSAKVIIQDYVFIGPRAIILPGVTLRKGAVVGAGAVVTKDVEEFAVVGGIPAVRIGERKQKDLHYKLGRAAWFR